MAGSDKRKQSLYFPEEMLKEIQEEATRQDRSLVVDRAEGVEDLAQRDHEVPVRQRVPG
jgi:uncharacterized small protein (TIGR04563 family)